MSLPIIHQAWHIPTIPDRVAKALYYKDRCSASEYDEVLRRAIEVFQSSTRVMREWPECRLHGCRLEKYLWVSECGLAYAALLCEDCEAGNDMHDMNRGSMCIPLFSKDET